MDNYSNAQLENHQLFNNKKLIELFIWLNEQIFIATWNIHNAK